MVKKIIMIEMQDNVLTIVAIHYIIWALIEFFLMLSKNPEFLHTSKYFYHWVYTFNIIWGNDTCLTWLLICFGYSERWKYTCNSLPRAHVLCVCWKTKGSLIQKVKKAEMNRKLSKTHLHISHICTLHNKTVFKLFNINVQMSFVVFIFQNVCNVDTWRWLFLLKRPTYSWRNSPLLCDSIIGHCRKLYDLSTMYVREITGKKKRKSTNYGNYFLLNFCNR